MAGQKRREVERASIPGNRFEPGLAGASDRGTSASTSNARQRCKAIQGTLSPDAKRERIILCDSVVAGIAVALRSVKIVDVFAKK